MKIVKQGKVPIKLWLDDMEDGAMEQAVNLSNLPFAFRHIAIMPDSHQGYGMPIGGVLATKGVVVPNAVGVDIGCGMCAVKTNIKIENISKDQIKQIMGKIRERIPVGFNKHSTACEDKDMPLKAKPTYMNIVSEEWNNAKHQLGTLGGGNHFIELQKDTEGILWVMVHSGSRNLGKKVADHYDKIAKKLNQLWYSEVSKDLAFLPLETKEAQEYLEEMNYCMGFALKNRYKMVERVLESIREVFGEFNPEPLINKNHNYARIESHFGENVIVHRKGATSAFKDELGIIPGSQGTFSYIVKGKGNPESFCSCSHGAGRKMGRNVARQTLSLEEERKKLDDKGIVHALRNQKDLDEAPGSYKDIQQVMLNQEDLVEIVAKLEPLGVVKG